jgi:hypothetical protein
VYKPGNLCVHLRRNVRLPIGMQALPYGENGHLKVIIGLNGTVRKGSTFMLERGVR